MDWSRRLKGIQEARDYAKSIQEVPSSTCRDYKPSQVKAHACIGPDHRPACCACYARMLCHSVLVSLPYSSLKLFVRLHNAAIASSVFLELLKTFGLSTIITCRLLVPA